MSKVRTSTFKELLLVNVLATTITYLRMYVHMLYY